MTAYYESPPNCVTHGLPIIVRTTQHLGAPAEILGANRYYPHDLQAEIQALRSDSQAISANIKDFIAKYKLCKQEHLILSDAQGILSAVLDLIDKKPWRKRSSRAPIWMTWRATLDHARIVVERFGKDTDNWYAVNRLNVDKYIASLPPAVPPQPMAHPSPPHGNSRNPSAPPGASTSPIPSLGVRRNGTQVRRVYPSGGPGGRDVCRGLVFKTKLTEFVMNSHASLINQDL